MVPHKGNVPLIILLGKNMNRWIHIILAGTLLSGCAVHREIDQAVERMLDPAMEINLVAIHFLEEEGRWPHSKEEFLDFADEKNLPFSREQYQDFTLEPKDDGTVVVSYRQISPHKGDFRMTLGPPERHDAPE